MQASLLDSYSSDDSALFRVSSKEKININELSLEEEELNCTKVIFREKFEKYIPKIDTEKEMISFLETTEERNLYEKYIASIYFNLNKKEIKDKKNLMKEININLINWLTKEKNNLDKFIIESLGKNNLNSIYININIFIGLLINFINLLEIFGIKNFTKSILIKNNFKTKLNDINNFLKNYLIPNFIKTNPKYNTMSLNFLLKKIEKILSKLKKQEECYELGKKIYDIIKVKKNNILGRKTLRENDISSSNDENDMNSTNESSEDKKNKKVTFDLNKNVVYYFDQNEIICK